MFNALNFLTKEIKARQTSFCFLNYCLLMYFLLNEKKKDRERPKREKNYSYFRGSLKFITKYSIEESEFENSVSPYNSIQIFVDI